MRRLGLLLVFSGFIGLLGAQDLTPPTLSGFSANPNPFSPNGDGLADTTVIGFSVSEPAYVTAWVDGTSDLLLDHTFYPTGHHTFTWDGGNYPEGPIKINFMAEDTAGNLSDTTGLWVVIDTTLPQILNVSFTPNPFSPDNNGIEDYCKIEFSASGTYPPNYADYFPPNRIGILEVWNDTGVTYYQFIPEHSPVLPPFPVYLYVSYIENNMASDLLLYFLDWGNHAVDVTLPRDAGPLSYRVGDLTNRFTDVEVWPAPIPIGNSARVAIYAFTGNASAEVYDPQGDLVFSTNFMEIFRGDGTYFTLFGPGPLPDGAYNVKIFLEDEAYNTTVKTGQIIANSVPTQVSDVSFSPPKISPENQDFLFDATDLRFNLSEDAHVVIRIYNSPDHFDQTHLVRTLLDSVSLSAGSHAIVFDGKNDANNFLSQGTDSVYYAVVKAIDPLSGDMDFEVAPIEIDNLPPPRPTVFPLPSPTRSTADTLQGVSEPGNLVRLYQNFLFYADTVADSITGHFTIPVEFAGGDNRLFVVSYDDVMNPSVPSETLRVVVDRTPPTLVEAYPADGSIQVDTLRRAWVRIQDNLAGTDFSHSFLVLKRGETSVSGSVVFHDPDSLILELSQPLLPGGTYDDFYTLEATLYDSAGNTTVDSLHFVFDTSPPDYEIHPADSSLQQLVPQVAIRVEDNLSGPDASASHLSLTGPNGEVPGNLTTVGDSLLLFHPIPPLKTDGTDDGRYYAALEVHDRAGNITRDTTTFLYDTRAPQILAVFPPTDTAFATPIDRVYVVVTDSLLGRESSGTNTSQSLIFLLNPSGGVQPGHKEVHGDTLFWMLDAPLAQTGRYTLVSIVQDFAENRDSLHSVFYFDQEGPALVGSAPAHLSVVRDTLPVIRVALSDGAGSGIDFNPAYTYLEVMSEDGASLNGTLSTNGVDSLVYQLNPPLLPTGSFDGGYWVYVFARDRVGNLLTPNPDTVFFIYDNHPPAVTGASPADGDLLVQPPESVVLYLSDQVPGVQYVGGMDYLASLVAVHDPNGLGIPGVKHFVDNGDGTGRLIWVFDPGYTPPYGEFQVSYTVYDRAGNAVSGGFTFRYLPSVNVQATLIPENGAAVRDTLYGVYAVLYAPSGAGIDFDPSVTWLRVLGPDGTEQPGVLSHHGDTLLYTFTTPLYPTGAQDGLYTVILAAQDLVGNTLPQNPDTATFVYDNIAPSVTTVFPGDSTYHAVFPDSVYVELSDLLSRSVFVAEGPGWKPTARTSLTKGLVSRNALQTRNTQTPLPQRLPVEVSGIDFDNSQIYLVAPNGQGIPGTRHVHVTSPNTGTLVWVPDPAYEPTLGWYLVHAVIRDRAGNVLEGDFAFRYVEAQPLSVTLNPEGTARDTLRQITASFTVPSEAPLDPAHTWIRFYRGDGSEVPGTLSLEGTVLTFHLTSPLIPNGTMDGAYTVVVSGQDLAGNALPQNPETLALIYDNLPPSVTAAFPPANTYLQHPIDSVYLEVSDNYSGINGVSGVDFNRSTLTLLDPSNVPVPGVYAYHDHGDGTGTLVYRLLENVALQQGTYTVYYQLQDLAGNRRINLYEFTAADFRPQVLAFDPDSGTITQSLSEIKAYLYDATRTGLDTAQTTSQLYLVSGQSVPGQRTFIEQDTLYVLTFVPNTPLGDGTYLFTVRPAAANGVQGDERTTVFQIDGTPPAVLQTYPEEDDQVLTAPTSLWIEVLETGSGVNPDASEFRLTNLNTGEDLLFTDVSQQGSRITLNLGVSLSYAAYRWTFRIVDMAGNWTADTVHFQVLEPIRVEPLFAEGDTLYGPLNYLLSVVKDLEGVGIQSVDMNLAGPRLQDTVPGTVMQINDTVYAFVSDTMLPGDGSANGVYRLSVKATNNNLHEVLRIRSFVFLFDTVPPAPPTLIEPLPDVAETNYINIQGRAEPFSTVYAYVPEVDPVQPVDSTITLPDSTFYLYQVPLAYGQYNTVKLVAVDLLGNRSVPYSTRIFSGPMAFTVRIPKPLRPDRNYIVVSTPEPATITWKIYNLAGDLVFQVTQDYDHRLTNQEIVWNDFKNLSGETVRNGPYLSVVQAHMKRSGVTEVHKTVIAVVK